MNCIKMLKWMLIGLALVLATSSRVNGNTNLCGQNVLSVVMIVDASGSVDISDFNLAKDAMIYMVEQMDVNPQKVHVGVISYDDQVTVFNTLVENEQHKKTLIDIIKNIPYTGGLTATGDALYKAQFLFSLVKRPITPQIAVLFTDGQWNHGSNVYTAADLLKKDEVDIFAVGIGPYLNDYELEYIASYPSSIYKKKVTDYVQLVNEMNSIVVTTCNTAAFIKTNEKARVDSMQGELRNFQLDLTKVSRTVPNDGDVSAPRASVIVIEVTVYKGVPDVKWSLDQPITTSNRDSIGTDGSLKESRLNKDGSRTFNWYVFPSPSNVRLYTSLKAMAPGENSFDMQLRAI